MKPWGRGEGIRARLKHLEEEQERKPPYSLIGRYYDELSQDEKIRWWKYVYGNAYTLEEAEAIELQYITRTLHFECTLSPSDYDLPGLKEFDSFMNNDRIWDNL